MFPTGYQLITVVLILYYRHVSVRFTQGLEILTGVRAFIFCIVVVVWSYKNEEELS